MNEDVVVEENRYSSDFAKKLLINNVDNQTLEQLYDNWTEVIDENGEKYRIVYYDNYYHIVPKSQAVHEVRIKER